MTFRQFLWNLAGWSRLTSMSWEDRGVAVSLSLGGRAQRIAHTIPQAVLAQQNGLHILLQRLEADLGAELQDRVKHAMRAFMRYRRAKGVSASEHVVEFERLYSEAVSHGMWLNRVTLTMLLIESASLSESQESWVLQTVAADYSRYAEVRMALRRLPSLDHRHQDSSAWPVEPTPHQPDWSSPSQEYQPFPSSGNLNIAPAEWSDSWSEMPALIEDHADSQAWPTEEDDESDDDYCSTCPTGADEHEQDAVVQAFAIIVRKKRSFKKANGHSFRRKGFKRTKQAWVGDSSRNASDTVPAGWDPKKWLARSKCPGCGSRWHRDCKGQGKSFPLFKRKGHGKGKGKNKGGGGKGKGSTAFGTFMLMAASALSTANSFVIDTLPLSSFHCQPCTNQTMNSHQSCTLQSFDGAICPPNMFDLSVNTANCPAFVFDDQNTEQTAFSLHSNVRDSDQNVFEQTQTAVESLVFDVLNDSPNIPAAPQANQQHVFSTEACRAEQICFEIPNQINTTQHVFHAYHLQQYLQTQDAESTFVGFEPFDSAYRIKRWEQFTATTKTRYAMLVDTGAPSSAAGINFVNTYLNAFNLTAEWIPFSARLSGIGEGAAFVQFKCKMPIGLCLPNSTLEGSWTAQCLEGIGKSVPPLLGLDAMTAAEAVIDFQALPYKMHCKTHQGRQSLNLEKVGGHIMLPMDWGGLKLGEQNEFYYNALGVHTDFDTDPDTYNTLDYTPLATKEKESESPVPPEFELFAANFNSTTTATTTTTSTSEPIHQTACATFTCRDGHETHFPANTARETTTPTTHRVGQETHFPANTARETMHAQPLTQHAYKTTTSTIKNKAPTKTTSPSNVSHHIVKMTAALRKTEKVCRILNSNQTYNKKYRGLPSHTPCPDTSNLTRGKWDVWEFWSGGGKLTKACLQLGLFCGPPLSHETGWCLLLSHHRQRIKELFLIHRPRLIMGAPVCSPWSNSCTTLDPAVKALVRAEQLIALNFFLELCQLQAESGKAFVIEQPQASELLRHEFGQALINLGAVDRLTHMCAHGLCDPENKMPNFKPTTLRGTPGVVTERTSRLCNKTHEHQQLQGRGANGKLRTAHAQGYTTLFCTRLAQDFKGYCRNHTKAYPARLRTEESDEEVIEIAEDDPYNDQPEQEEDETELTRAARAERMIEEAKARRIANPAPSTPLPTKFPPRLMPTAKRSSQKPAESAIALPPGLGGSVRASSSTAPPSDLAVAVPTDALAPAPLVANTEDQLAVRRKQADEAMSNHLNNLAEKRKRYAPGNAFVISTGPQLAMIQELFGTPHGKTVKVAVLAHSPPEPASPEPMVSRHVANLSLVMTRVSEDSNWTIEPWGPYEVKANKYKKRPLWQFTAFGHARLHDDFADHTLSTPLDTVAEQTEHDAIASRSLPAVLKALSEGNTETQIQVILALHRRLYHRKSDELRELLHKSGVPLRALTLVNEACNRCDVCRRWAAVAAKASVKTRLSGRFNHLVYADLVFIGQPAMMFFVCVDDAIRYTTCMFLEWKDFSCLEKALRRSWIQHFGPMSIIRSDREGSMASEAFGVVCEKLGIVRELVTAGESHGFLGPLDRRVQIIRNHAPIIMDLLAEANITIEPEDLAAEIQIDLNTGLSYAGVTPYACLYGAHPRPVFTEDSEEISASSDAEPFYEHQQIRLRSCAAFQRALIQYRVQRASTARPRKELQSSYSVGDTVDIYRRPKQKDLTGWRGPATVLALLGEGLITVRWQSTVYDVPVHHIRPHINISSTKALPPTVQPPTAVASIPDNPMVKMMKQWDKEEFELQQLEQALDKPTSETEPSDIIGFCLPEHHAWELFYDEEVADQLKPFQVYFDTLASIASSMPQGTVQNHSVEVRKGSLHTSRDAVRDMRAIFSVGRNLAKALGIHNYSGIILGHGRRQLPVLPGMYSHTCIYWIHDPAVATQFTVQGSAQVDFIRQGVRLEELNNLKCICILEAQPEQDGILKKLLNQVPEEVQPDDDVGRVRFELSPERILPHPEQEMTETVIASSYHPEPDEVWDPNYSTSEILACQLRGIDPPLLHSETKASQRHLASLRKHYPTFDKTGPCEAFTASMSSRDTGAGIGTSECVFLLRR
jgi:hypothetical protein